MPHYIHILRHGQGYHSAEVTAQGHTLHDPSLTDKGRQQCRDRSADFDRHDKTCQTVFAPCLARGLVIVAQPAAEEVSDQPCDTGSPVSDLVTEFGPETVDFTALTLDWFKKAGEYATDAKAVNARALKLRQWIKARPEKEVALVSHGFFNHFLTGEVDDAGVQTTPWWNEAELRTYTFKQGTDDLVETEDSLRKRGLGNGSTDKSAVKINQPNRRGSSSEGKSGETTAV